ncbi:hypothetical protein D3C84_1240040 [compost metagenome]
MIDFRLLQGAQPVVDATIHIEYLAVVLYEGDSGQEAGSLQPIAIKVPGRDVGGGHQHNAMTK